MLLYNNVGLMSKVSEDTVTKSTKKAVYHHLTTVCRPLSIETPQIQTYNNVYSLLLLMVHWATFLPIIVWVYLLSIFYGGH